MKNVRNIIIVFCLVISSLFLASCKNFLSGNDVLEELNKTIDYLNLPYVKVYISADSEGVKEILPAANIYEDKYKKGDKLQLSVQEKDDYYFTKWTANPENAVLFTTEENESPEMQRVVTAEIVESVETITIKPEILRKEFAKITIAADSVITKEIIPPANVYNDIYKTYDTIDLSFAEKDEYQFVYWDVEPKNYVEFISQKNTDGTKDRLVTAKILRADKPITIKPVVMKRPEVLLYSPMYNADGAYRDAKIQVIFDKAMSPECIFFTNEEVTQIKNGYPNVTLLQNKDKKVYGYQKEDGTLCYKNIEIMDKNHNKNILSCFAEPRFEFDDTLIIPTKNGENAPEPGTNILVKLTNFYCEEDGQKVSISGNFSWIYSVNSKYDTTPPSLEDGCYVNFYKDEENQLVSTTLPAFTDSGIKDYFKSIYLSQNKLTISSLVFDGGSGVALENGCFAKIKRLYDENYAEIQNPKEETLFFQGEIAESMAKYDVTINFKDPSKTFADGLYQINLYFKDQNGNTTDVLKSAYFLLDNTGPAAVENLNTTYADGKFVTNWEISKIFDYSYAYISCEDSNGNKDDAQKVDTTTYTKTNGIESEVNYTFTVVPYDIFGHKGKAASFKKSISSYLSVSKIVSDRESWIDADDSNNLMNVKAYFDNIPAGIDTVTFVIVWDEYYGESTTFYDKVYAKIQSDYTASATLTIPQDGSSQRNDGYTYKVTILNSYMGNSDKYKKDPNKNFFFKVQKSANFFEPGTLFDRKNDTSNVVKTYIYNSEQDSYYTKDSKIELYCFDDIDIKLLGVNLDLSTTSAQLFKKVGDDENSKYEEYSEMLYFDKATIKDGTYGETRSSYTNPSIKSINLRIPPVKEPGFYKIQYYKNGKEATYTEQSVEHSLYEEFEVYGDPEFTKFFIPPISAKANPYPEYVKATVKGKYFKRDKTDITKFNLDYLDKEQTDKWTDSIKIESDTEMTIEVPIKQTDPNNYCVELLYNTNRIEYFYSITDKWSIGDILCRDGSRILYSEDREVTQYNFSDDKCPCGVYIGTMQVKIDGWRYEKHYVYYPWSTDYNYNSKDYQNPMSKDDAQQYSTLRMEKSVLNIPYTFTMPTNEQISKLFSYSKYSTINEKLKKIENSVPLQHIGDSSKEEVYWVSDIDNPVDIYANDYDSYHSRTTANLILIHEMTEDELNEVIR